MPSVKGMVGGLYPVFTVVLSFYSEKKGEVFLFFPCELFPGAFSAQHFYLVLDDIDRYFHFLSP